MADRSSTRGLSFAFIVLAAVLASSAAAADGQQRAFNWTGFYVGAHAELATGDTQGGVPGVSFTSTDYDLDGALYGGHAGYNYQMGATVLGIEGSLSAADIDGSTGCLFFLTCRREVDWVATVTGRLGYAIDRTMLYAQGGVAWGDVNTDVEIAGFNLLSGSETHVGWVVGFGVEHAMSDRVLLRIAYSHIDLGSETHDLTGCCFSVPSKVEATIDSIRLGASFKLSD